MEQETWRSFVFLLSQEARAHKVWQPLCAGRIEVRVHFLPPLQAAGSATGVGFGKGLGWYDGSGGNMPVSCFFSG